jgi:hypothetical protein
MYKIGKTSLISKTSLNVRNLAEFILGDDFELEGYFLSSHQLDARLTLSSINGNLEESTYFICSHLLRGR